ncbi:MAG TPA: hypothetical protein DDZ88_17620 [Verrucomicrobiales bacterium]|nr:hypothetical protein [Verrucomicrobiales bacterium]
MNTIPLQFLVGATRLIAICFGLKALEDLAGAAAYYATIQRSGGEFAQAMPGAWGLYLPGAVTSLVLAIGVWFIAPFICRFAMSSKETSLVEPASDVTWNELMIFLTGTLFLGWGLTRLADSLIPILRLKAQGVNQELAMVEQIGFYTTTIIIGIGGIMMSRFASIYRWIQRRKGLLNNPGGTD